MSLTSRLHEHRDNGGQSSSAAPVVPAQEMLSPEARATIRARLRSELSDLDYVRALARWSATGLSQRQIATQLGVTQPAVSKALARSGRVAPAVPGFAGATPLEIAKRYAAGELTREQVVEQLVAFPYAAVERHPYDDVTPDPPGAWSEVEHAQGLGYIDIGIYDEVHTRRTAERTGVTAYLSLTGEAIEPSPQARESALARSRSE